MIDAGAWAPLTDHLQVIPDASVAVGRERYLDLLSDAFPRVARTLVDLGFGWEELPDGGARFVIVASGDLLMRGGLAAADWLEAQLADPV